LKFSALAISLASLATFNTAFALPTGENIRSGSADIARDGNSMVITQNTNRVAIDWNTFNVDRNELVRFNQNGGIALNRVVGNDLSSIFGRIQSDGTVILINPNGILFGEGCQIDTGAFIASTKNISDDIMTNFSMSNDPLISFEPDEHGNIVNMNGIIKADKVELGEDGEIYLKSSNDALITGDTKVNNFIVVGENINLENGTFISTGDTNLISKVDTNINSPITSTGNLIFGADYDKDYKGMVSVGANISTDKDLTFYAPTTGTYFNYPSGKGNISAKDINFYGNVAVDNSTLDIDTENITFYSNIDSANSYNVYENGSTYGADVKDEPAMKSLAKFYYENYLKNIVYKDFENLTSEEYAIIRDRCLDEYKGYHNRPLPTDEQEAVKAYFNENVKLSGLTEATDFDNLTDDQYTQLAKHILTTFAYNNTDNRESILNIWANAVNSAKEGTEGGDAVGDKYLATITDSLENWRVTSMLKGKSYEYFLGGRTDIVGKNIKDNRVFKWYTGISKDVVFFTSTGEGEGITHTYSAWSKDPNGIFGYVFNEPNNNSNYDQPYVAIGWHDNSGNSWADVDDAKNTVRGLIQEINNPRSTINITYTGSHEEKGKVGDSVPITINFNKVEPIPKPEPKVYEEYRPIVEPIRKPVDLDFEILIIKEVDGKYYMYGEYYLTKNDREVDIELLDKNRPLPKVITDSRLSKTSVNLLGGEFYIDYDGVTYSITPANKEAERIVEDGDATNNEDVVEKALETIYVDNLRLICVHFGRR